MRLSSYAVTSSSLQMKRQSMLKAAVKRAFRPLLFVFPCQNRCHPTRQSLKICPLSSPPEGRISADGQRGDLGLSIPSIHPSLIPSKTLASSIAKTMNCRLCKISQVDLTILADLAIVEDNLMPQQEVTFAHLMIRSSMLL